MDGKNEKSVSQLAKLPRLRPLELKSEFLLEFEFLKKLQSFVFSIQILQISQKVKHP